MSDDRPTLEIRDPAIDAQAVLRRMREGVASRRAAGAYDPDLLTLGPETLRPGGAPAAQPDPTFLDVQPLYQALAEMSSRAHLHELMFTSPLPVLGHLVAAVRRAWSWMAARWIGQHLSSQQTTFNEATVRLGNELLHWQEANLWRVRQLERRVREMEAQLARLEAVSRPEEEEKL